MGKFVFSQHKYIQPTHYILETHTHARTHACTHTSKAHFAESKEKTLGFTQHGKFPYVLNHRSIELDTSAKINIQ